MVFQLQHQSFQRIFRTDFLSVFLAISLRITLLSAVLSFGLRSEWRSLGPFPLCCCVSLLRPLLPFSWAHLCCLRTGLHSTCSTSRAWSYAGSRAGLARMLEKGQARPRCWRVPGSDPSPRGPDCRRIPRPAAPLPTSLRDPRASRLQSCSIRALPTLGDGPALSGLVLPILGHGLALSPVWCSGGCQASSACVDLETSGPRSPLHSHTSPARSGNEAAQVRLRVSEMTSLHLLCSHLVLSFCECRAKGVVETQAPCPVRAEDPCDCF